MKVVIPGYELNRMMKTLVKCVDKRNQSFSNVEVIWEGTELKIRGTNGQQFCEMVMPMMGGNGEHFALDAGMLDKIAGNAGSRDVEITVDGRNCYIKANGRVRTGVMDTEIQDPVAPGADKFAVFDGELFKSVYKMVSDAVGTDESRQILTGVQMAFDGSTLTMTGLDGFQLARYSMACEKCSWTGAVTVPKVLLEMVISGIGNEAVTMTVDGNRVQFETDGMRIVGTALSGQYPDVQKIIPENAKTEARVSTGEMKNALKGCDTVGKSNLVKVVVGQDGMTIRNNSEEAEYEQEIACDVSGDGLKIAFNGRYLMNILNAVAGDDMTMRFVSAVQPMVVKVEEEAYSGTRMVLPVRVNEC